MVIRTPVKHLLYFRPTIVARMFRFRSVYECSNRFKFTIRDVTYIRIYRTKCKKRSVKRSVKRSEKYSDTCQTWGATIPVLFARFTNVSVVLPLRSWCRVQHRRRCPFGASWKRCRNATVSSNFVCSYTTVYFTCMCIINTLILYIHIPTCIYVNTVFH